MLTFWITVVVLGAGAAALGVRYMMIEAAMVDELIRCDPDFRPRYGNYLGPTDRTFNVREYRRRLPDGPLSRKLRHTLWALGVWVALAMAWVLIVRPSP